MRGDNLKTEYPDNFTRKRAERQRRARKRRIITFLIAFLILICVTLITLCFTIFFPITQVQVSGSKIYSADEVSEASFIKVGDNMFAFSAEKLENEIRSKLPYIADVKVKRNVNGTLKLNLTDAKEKFCYKTDEGYFSVGEDGFVLNQYTEQPSSLMLVLGVAKELKVGTFAEFDDTAKKEIFDKFLEYGKNTDITGIDLTDEYAINISVANRFEVYIGTSNNIKEKLAHLNSMIREIDESKSGKINLSYWSKEKPEGTFVEKKEE
ncbi:MAG: FtsQ-type POTRA domain-containing protein [Clostridia bacterium]|nr:FtsQ-type POTRA domain-containing protein [Clostridia bacterium]